MQENLKANNMLIGLAVLFPLAGAVSLYINFDGYVISSIDPMYVLKTLLPFLFWVPLFIIVAKGARGLKSWARLATLFLGVVLIIGGLLVSTVFSVALGIFAGAYLVLCSWKKWEIPKKSQTDLPDSWDAMMKNVKDP